MDLKKILQFEIGGKKNKTTSFFGLFEKIKNWWFRGYRKVFIAVFALVIVAGCYTWYASLYQSQWSAEQKKQYIDSQEKKEAFSEREFNEIIKAIEEREKKYQEETEKIKDIFKKTK